MEDQNVIAEEPLTMEDAASRLVAVAEDLERRLGGQGSDGAHFMRVELLIRKTAMAHLARSR